MSKDVKVMEAINLLPCMEESIHRAQILLDTVIEDYQGLATYTSNDLNVEASKFSKSLEAQTKLLNTFQLLDASEDINSFICMASEQLGDLAKQLQNLKSVLENVLDKEKSASAGTETDIQ